MIITVYSPSVKYLSLSISIKYCYLMQNGEITKKKNKKTTTCFKKLKIYIKKKKKIFAIRYGIKVQPHFLLQYASGVPCSISFL